MPFTIEIALSGKKNVQSHLVRWVQLTGTTTSDRTGFYKQSKKWFAYVHTNTIPTQFNTARVSWNILYRIHWHKNRNPNLLKCINTFCVLNPVCQLYYCLTLTYYKIVVLSQQRIFRQEYKFKNALSKCALLWLSYYVNEN